MLSKTLLVLAVSSLVQDVVALGHRQHGHQVMHQKRAVVTEVITETAYVYVTLSEAEATSSSAVGAKKFYTRKKPARLSKTPTTAAAESTAAPSAASVVAEAFPRPGVPAPAPSAEAPAAPEAPATPPSPVSPPAAEPVPANPPAADPAPATPPSGGSGSGPRGRGLPYNDPNLLGRFLNGGSHISWTYNWAQTDDSKTGLDFVPMCWGTTKGFPATWPTNAQKMIDAGAKALFSFNEPDHSAQANLSPQQAAASHIELMNPFAGKARISTPSITNGGGNMGINWLQQWFDACAGNCAADFVNIHIYGVDTNTFLQHTLNVHNQFKKPVWITEFALDGSEEQINQQLQVIIDQFENNSTFSFVERYAYFMAADGYLVKGSSMSKYGNTFAYAS